MTTHVLKTWPAFFEPVWAGEKTFEIRFDDRAYQRGDTVELCEWDPHAWCECRDRQHRHDDDCPRFTGRTVVATIGHVTSSTPPRGNQRGFDGRGYVVFSLCDLARTTPAPTAAEPEPPRSRRLPTAEQLSAIHKASRRFGDPQ